MTLSGSFQIHEFSTGIRYQGTANNWVSLGFTGQYMNITISQIPYAVERSIANKEFAVAEGASSDEPAVIGRVVLGNVSNESDWSVIAVVTRGRDEKGRSASLYRYFLCEGSDSLWKILSWIEEQRKNGKMPVFDPFEVKTIGQPNQWQCSHKLPISLNLFESLLRQPAPIVISPSQPCTALIINEMATIKATASNQTIAWAFKVEALEQPGRFQVIYPASDRAFNLLQRAIASSAIVVAPVVADEQAIKSAIKGLINSSTVKPEYIQSIASSLGNTQIPETYWRDIFDGQGANNALKQGIYSPQMVRLMVLRAIAVPPTLPEYLTWLEKGNKQNDCHKVAADFESQLKNYLNPSSAIAPNIGTKIREGFQVVLSFFINEKISPEALNKLITSPNGLWAEFLSQFIRDLKHDLNLMNQFASGQTNLNFKLKDASWQTIWRELRPYWGQRQYIYQEKYQPFAQLFKNLNEPKIAAFFYHVGYGKVPKKIFAQLGINGFYTKVYGIVVQREVTILEFLLLKLVELGGKIMPVALVVPIVVVTFILGFTVRGLFIPDNKNISKQPETENVGRNSSSNSNNTANDPQPNSQSLPNVVNNSGNSPSRGQQNQQTQNPSSPELFNKTRTAINKIAEQLANASNSKYKVSDIKNKMLEIIEQTDLSPEVIDANYPNYDQNQLQKVTAWVNAIKKYQQERIGKTSINQSDGVININGPTSEVLKCEIARNLDIKLNAGYEACQSVPPL